MATVESEAANGTLEAPDTGSSSTESPTQGVPLTVKIVQGRRFPPIGIFKRQGRFFVQITVDKNKKITATSARSNDPLWGEPLKGLSAQDSSSSLMVEVYAKRTIFKNMFIGGFEIPHVLSLPQSEEHLTRILRAFGRQRSTLGTASLELIITRPSTAPVGNSKELMSPVPAIADAPERFESLDVSGMNDPRVVHETSPDPVNVPQTASSSVEDIEPGPGSVGPSTTSADNAPPGVPSEELRQAVDAMHVPRFLGGAGSFVDTAQTTFGGLALYSDTWEPLWRKVGLCVNLADGIAEIHPYARIAWSVLSYIPRTLSAQVERDRNIIELLNAIDGAYDFVKQAMSLENRKEALVKHQKMLLAGIVKQITECAYFILDYAKDTNFWKRTIKNAVNSKVDARRQAYLDKLEQLKKEFLGHAVVTTEITVFLVQDSVSRVQDSVSRVQGIVKDISNDLKEHDIDSKLHTIPYVGAGFQSDNGGCLPGTREAFLENIEKWINDPDSQHRVCVIFGQAGTGKSSIAHEVTRRFEQLRRLGSSFCFNRDEQTSRRPQRLFFNIARDLAYYDTCFKQALSRAICDGAYLRHQDDISWQLENLVLKPMKDLRVVGPLVLVIDALDESGDEGVREKMLAILANRVPKLPACFRIVITSRAEPDITDIFDASDVSNHIRFLRMDDNSLAASTPIDILAYIRSRRDKSKAQLQAFLNEDRCRMLAEKSERLFQWASVACNYLTKSEGGLTTSDQFKNLVNTSTNGTPLDALYKLYQGVLQQRFKITNNVVEGRFKSVMGRVLAAFEPLSLSSLAELHPPNDDPEQYDGVLSVVGPLSSLLSGVHDPSTPIRPLHTSFRDFLVNKQHSLKFHINTQNYHSDLAFACLRTLNTHLKFNMCRLETSYAFNKDVPNLDERVPTSIPPFMSYACRFWAQHLQLSKFDDAIYHHVRRLLVDKLLFWLEALSLLREVETAVPSLKCVVEWTKGHPAADDARTMATDAYRFVRLFGACITDSAPHVYVSALPFTPESSHVFRNYGRHFPRIPRVCTGRANTWPQMDMVLTGHDESVHSVSFSPDGRQIVSGSDDGTIRLWSAVTGEAIGALLEGHTGGVLSVAFSPDGKRIVSGSDDKTIRLWSTTSETDSDKTIRVPLEGHTSMVNSVAFSPDGKHIVSGSWDGTVRVWSTETGEAIGAPREGRIYGVTSVAFSPDGKHIVSGSSDKTIHVWRTETSEAIGAPLEGHTDCVNSLAFSPDGKHIVSGSDDNTIRLWSLETREAICAPLEGHTRGVRSVAFTPDGRHIVSGSWDTTVRVWSAETGEAIGAPLKGHTSGVESVAFSPDGKHIVSGSLDKTIHLWSAETGEAISALLEGHTDMVTSVAFSPDDEHITSGSDDDTIHLWSTATGEAIGAPNAGHAGRVTSVAFSLDGKHIVSGSKDKTIRLWSSETGEAIGAPMKGHTHEVDSVAFSPDGRQIISVSWDSICVWSAETGEAIGAPLALKGHRARRVEPVAFSPDGKCIVFGYRDWAIRLWSSETGKAIGAPLEGHTRHITSVAFSPDGKHIASGSEDNTIRLWSSETRAAIGKPLEGHTDGVESVAFSPDGKHIVSGSWDGTVRLWSSETCEAICAPLQCYTEYVASVAFSPDGRCIVAGSDDGTIRLWSWKMGEAIGTPPELKGHRKVVTSVAFSPDGRCIASGSEDSTIRLWSVHNKREGVSFSRNPSHALANPDILLGSTSSPSETDARDLLHMQEDSWLVGPESRLLLWVPTENRRQMHWVREDFVIGQHTTELDLSDFAHGPNWHECYVGEDRDVHGGSGEGNL